MTAPPAAVLNPYEMRAFERGDGRRRGQIDAERHQPGHQASLHRTQAGDSRARLLRASRAPKAPRSGWAKHDAERKRRAGQPQKILHPQHRRVADACRKQRRAHAARRSRARQLSTEKAERSGRRKATAARPSAAARAMTIAADCHGDDSDRRATSAIPLSTRIGGSSDSRSHTAATVACVHVARPPKRTRPMRQASPPGAGVRLPAAIPPSVASVALSTLTSPPCARRKPRHRAPAMNRLTTYSRKAAAA